MRFLATALVLTLAAPAFAHMPFGKFRPVCYVHTTDAATPVDTFAAVTLRALTVTQIQCIATGTTPSVPVTVQECSSTGTSCADTEGAITCDADGGMDDGTITDGALDAGDWIFLNFGAPSGTIASVTVLVCGY